MSLITRRRLVVLVVCLLVVAFLTLVPFRYVIEIPGPTYNVLGAVDSKGNSLARKDKNGSPMIDFGKNNRTYSADGELRMVTVGMIGGPERHVSLAELIMFSFRKDVEVIPEDQVFPKGVTAAQVQKMSSAQMVNSQDSAEAAAYLYLGMKVPITSKVYEPFPGSPFEKGDELVSLTNPNGTFELNYAPTLHQQMRLTPPGTKISVVVRRKGQLKTLSVTTKKTGDPYRKGSLMGIYLDEKAQLPLQAKFPLKDVGGPSAGMIFAVGIIDLLTPGSLTGGKKIAGTGTIHSTGEVGQISGLAQKISGATKDGAQYFLFPKQNCPDYAKLDQKELKLKAYPVGTLEEAVQAVKAIAAGKAPAQTKCSAADTKPVTTKK